MSSQVRAQIPRDARRIVVRGGSGSGKTTLARRLGEVLGVEHLELDSVFHQAGWTPIDDASFRARIDALDDSRGWAVCGNYRQVALNLLDRADTVVLLDLPRRVVMARVVARTLRRVVRREELWNGNRERWRNVFSTDPEQSVIAWSWTTHGRKHDEIAAFLADPPNDHIRIVHVATPADERYLYAGLAALRSTVGASS